MTDVRDVLVTREAAEELGLNPSYLIKYANKLQLNDSEMRAAGSRNYLFSREAVEKIKKSRE